jgi:hypothetical protein
MRIKSAPSAVQPYPRYAACANIKEFGAVGNGTADDAVALQNAINNVGSGCSIFFPPGVYKLASTITINKDITLQLGPQVEIRQFARLVPSSNAAWSLTVQGEGPGTSVWRQAVEYPFWSGSSSLRFRNLRMFNFEFSPYAVLDNPHNYGGSTDILEMGSVTASRGSSDQFRAFSLRTGDPGVVTAALNVLRDISLSGINLSIECQNTDLRIERLQGTITSGAGIWVVRSTGSGVVSVSSIRLNIGETSRSAVSPVFGFQTLGPSRMSVSLNDVEINTGSWDAAIAAETPASGTELNLLVNALRFTVTANVGAGYAVRTQDSSGGILRAVLSACFFRTTFQHTDAAIQGTLSNANSLRTLAGVDQRGWASLT